eukprot:SAG31_NODE_763_length_12265_cov_3.024984_14_plen_79_part_00
MNQETAAVDGQLQPRHALSIGLCDYHPFINALRIAGRQKKMPHPVGRVVQVVMSVAHRSTAGGTFATNYLQGQGGRHY